MTPPKALVTIWANYLEAIAPVIGASTSRRAGKFVTTFMELVPAAGYPDPGVTEESVILVWRFDDQDYLEVEFEGSTADWLLKNRTECLEKYKDCDPAAPDVLARRFKKMLSM